MVGDDDIPVLTKVVKRERRAQPTLTEDMRRAIIAEISERVSSMVSETVQSVAVDIDALLSREVTAMVEARLPELLDAAIREQVRLARGESADSE